MSTVDQGCKACNRPSHAEDMVACDNCGTWFHFTCAGVKASICDKPWRCGYCSSRASSVSGSKSSVRTSSSCAQMRLRQLEESKALDDRLMHQQAERERAYLAQKHQLEAEIETAKSICGSGRSARSLRSHRSHRSHVQLWINQSQETPEKQPGECMAVTTSTPIISSGNVVLEVPCRNDTIVHYQNVHQPMIPAQSVVNHTQTISSVTPVVSAATSNQCQQQPGMLRQKGILMNNPRDQHSTFQTVQNDMQHSSAAQQVTFRDPFGQHPPGQSTMRLQPTNQSEFQESAVFYQQPIVESSVRTNVQFEGPVNAAARNAQRSSHQQIQVHSTPPMNYTAPIPDISRRVSNPGRTTVGYIQNSAAQIDSYGPWNPNGNVGYMSDQQHVTSGNQFPFITSTNASCQPNNIHPPCYSGWPSTSSSLLPPVSLAQPIRQVPQVSSGLEMTSNLPEIVQVPVGVLTTQQLAARQVVSRELPKFSGDPLEWPMFINAFESTTAMCGIQPDENLARLQKSLVGSARDKVQSILTLPAAIPEIIETLRDECGRPEQLIHCLLAKIRNAPPPNSNRLDTLITFGREVKNLVTYVEGARLQNHLSNPMLLAELVGKLPPNLRLDWGLHTQRIPEATLKAFSDYVSSIKTAACHVSLPTEISQQEASCHKGRKREKGAFVNAHTVDEAKGTTISKKSEASSDPRPCHACSKMDHRIRNCQKFSSFNLDQRKRLVEQFKLCHQCLGSHGKWPCRSKQICGIDGCADTHHKLLHALKRQPANVEVAASSGLVSTHCFNRTSALFKILPVVLYNEGKTVTTYAFLDDGSDLTLLENTVAEELGLTGEMMPLCLQWTGNVTRKESTSEKVRLHISGVNEQSKYIMSDVRTVASLDLPHQSLAFDELAKQYPYLRGIPVNNFSKAVPRILIGLAHAKLTLTLDKRERRSGEPIAAKTRLGWTIFGGRGEKVQGPHHVMVHTCSCSPDMKLHELVKDYFAVENIGVNAVQALEPPEDQRARQILQRTTKRTQSGRFECGLLWKSDTVELPDSYKMAERRLVCLEKRLGKEPALKRKVEEQIGEYMERGYAHVATKRELCNLESHPVWYLPLGVVQNPRKPGKIRLVWDAAARVGDVSLNAMLLVGPDLLTPLLKVMSGFRQRQFAVVGDVRQMFHQILVRPSDKQALRFLFRSDPNDSPTVYVMDVVIFGASCSPCIAQHVKNINAAEYVQQYPEAAAAVINNTYVDDFLDSRDTIEEIVQIIKEVRLIHSKASFEIRNWQSNSDEVLQRVGVDVIEAAKCFSVETSTVSERVLGMAWVPTDDMFVFTTVFHEDLRHLLAGEVIPTKRQVLRVVMSHFDPIGVVATYTVHGKILIQDIWRSAVKWDEPITAENFKSWQRWVKWLPMLSEVRVPRCYFPGYNPFSYRSLEVHVFVDASEMACCAVAFFRIIDEGVPRCALVAAKTKVTPLKPQSIPRNELNAAVLGARLLKNIEENHTIPIQRKYMWSDSTTVLSWLRADPRKYRQYVAFRVGEILSTTNVSEWYYVPSSLNVADKGTKWGTGPCFEPTSPWFNGPQFLSRLDSDWPSQKIGLTESIEEVRSVHHHATVSDYSYNYRKYSRWEDLIKSLAYVYHFIHRCKAETRTFNSERRIILEQRDYAAAEASLWRVIQQQVYDAELTIIKQNIQLPREQRKHLKKTSPLAKLSPFIDEEGVLRMDSRLNRATTYYSYTFRNPVIIPRGNHATELLIQKYHQRYGHANIETVINELRQRYHIPKIRFEVKSVIRKCMWCKVYRARPQEPRMAALPQPRVTPYVRPFTFTGLDYFGPLIIKRGRSNEKRWVALFTCLTVRAVHIEVAHSLSTDSSKKAIRRFIARRGSPQQIYSDNGTNFRGAARELANEIRTINRDVASTFTNGETEWIFNPPSAPHMGGVWERKVRSIKEAFKSLCHTDRLNDEELVTFLAEAELLVNSHPLTFVPVESPTEEILTPNSFLLLSSNGDNTTTRIPVNQEVSLQRNRKLMNDLLNQFWKRWIQGYLPTIARRTKWFNDVRPLRVGDPVIIVDETVRNGWLRGRVVKVYQGMDDQVRKVDVKTSSGVLQRPAIKVALLDVQENGKTNQG